MPFYQIVNVSYVYIIQKAIKGDTYKYIYINIMIPA